MGWSRHWCRFVPGVPGFLGRSVGAEMRNRVIVPLGLVRRRHVKRFQKKSDLDRARAHNIVLDVVGRSPD